MLTLIAVLVAGSAPPSELAVAPPPRSKIVHLSTYDGEVLAVDKRSITIRGHEHGLLGQQEKITRVFQACDALLRGEQDPREKSASDYRLIDVQVGDKVWLMLHPSGVDDICAAVRIYRRPGGFVPPAPFEDPSTRDPYHVMMNAFQAFEEKGIPLPLKYNVEFQRAVSAEERANFEKQLAKLKHDDRMRFEGRIAPMPRPVVRK